jgi:peptidoglycan hydrolase-like protein with peptidoglycan-binding domain
MILLTVGTVLPVVTTTQILLRRHRPNSLIDADGIYGSPTKGAVVAFQKFHSLKPDGIVGRSTWGELMDVSGFQTIDVVDGTDPSLVAMEATDIRNAGGDPIVVYGMSNGVEFVMQQIAAKAVGPKRVALLRFHGHGNKGMQNVTGGEISGAPHLAGISDGNFVKVQGSLQRISEFFVEFGSVQLLGCNVGGGPKGKALLQKLSTVWGVPVTAGIQTQFGGGVNTFIFEGPTQSAFPNGMDLRTWSRQQQQVNGNVTMPA